MWDELKKHLKRQFDFTPNLNQWQEITRLTREISIREGLSPGEVLHSLDEEEALKNAVGRDTFFALKKRLLQRRFPLTASREKIDGKKVFLPSLKPAIACRHPEGNFVPEKIYIEKNVRSGCLARRFREKFPGTETEELDSYTDFVRRHGYDPAGLKKPLVFIVKENWDFVKPCPCTKGVLGCGYWIFNLGFGCPFDCSYCFLQQYSNIPGIVLPSNLEDFFVRFDDIYSRLDRPVRIGTGEFCDSLALDEITGYSTQLIDYFRDKNLYFELKTKSAAVSNILKAAASDNIVISWSLNPETLIESDEKAAAGLHDRLQAAARVSKKGFSLGFHFDPVIYSDGWEKEYAGLIDTLYARLKPPFKWISLGTLRSHRDLKPVVEQRFPQSRIFYGELFLGKDKKLRYPDFLRVDIYKKMVSMIRKYDSRTPVYLCMEPKEIWQACGYPFSSPQDVENYLIDRK